MIDADREGTQELRPALSAELRQDVEAYAARHGLELAEALRYLVDAGLAAEAHAMLEGRPIESDRPGESDLRP